jgi:hypothetical protein
MKRPLATLAWWLLLGAAPAFGQGCAMCYSSAKSASKDGQRAISRGVLILGIPPVSFLTVGVGFALRYGKKRDQDHNRDHNDNM